ncbi:MAG TPA: hypothetical protein VNH18_07090 [Bryobacteraceae bacterium]|nr:hypothetical protein [Bryobacteraceae bacterium]
MKQTRQTGPFTAITKFDRSGWRLCVLFVVILALLGVATASASPAHFHPKTATGCDVCLTASHTAAAKLGSTQLLQAPQTRRAATLILAHFRYELLRYHASHTRGPPSLAL